VASTPRRLLNTFVAGALAALPLAATALIFVWGARLAVDYLGPGSVTGNILMSIGLTIGGSELVAYLIGALIVVVAIFLLGALVQSRMRNVLSWLFDSVMRRIPVVRSVYGTVSKFVGLLGQRDDESPATRSMSPVWLHFGGVGGAAVLGLLSTPEPVRIGDIDYLAVLVPTSPVPVGGGLLYVPREWVMPANVGVEGLTSIYVSMGITSPQHLKATAELRRP
jgi:uncharacterized membrane protein